MTLTPYLIHRLIALWFFFVYEWSHVWSREDRWTVYAYWTGSIENFAAFCCQRLLLAYNVIRPTNQHLGFCLCHYRDPTAFHQQRCTLIRRRPLLWLAASSTLKLFWKAKRRVLHAFPLRSTLNGQYSTVVAVRFNITHSSRECIAALEWLRNFITLVVWTLLC